MVTECFLNFWTFLISNKLEQSEFKLEKIIGIENVFEKLENEFSNFSCVFLNPTFFSNLNSKLLDWRNLQQQVEKHSVTKIFSELTLRE